ncbi:hypothetical protein HMPREF9072_00440 [Capnocytophaga sp. oral taxon 324 str. F0483]|nr:hypothetical protein HMPREF9072_00440 [Capnocytophaga sp. oral taxon 324 str. F0483]
MFVFCLSARAARTVFCSSFLHLTFPLLHSLSLGEGWGEDILFVFSLSVCRATTARVARSAYRATTSHRFSFKACPPSGVRGLSPHCHSSLIWYFWQS